MSELITKNMPEPEYHGRQRELYLVLDPPNPDVISFPQLLVHESGGSEETWGVAYDEWYTWQSITRVFEGRTIESLSDHDKRIRRDALSLTEEERKQADRVSIECGRMATGGYVLDSQLFYLAKSRERES